jgi:heme exporter protein A
LTTETSAGMASRTAPKAGAPVLSVQGLGAQRGERPLFRGLALTLLPGQLMWLRGRNGRGKTTLLRVLAGLAPPARGQALLDGQAVNRLPAALRTRLLYLAHANGLKDDLTVTESLRFLSQLQGAHPTPGQLDTALVQVGMGARATALVRTLSQGQRRRAALGRLALDVTFSPAPAVWLLDEPFDALDDDGVQMLNDLLTRHAHRGGSALLTSHQAVTVTQPVVQTLDLDPHAFQPAVAAA